MGKLSWYEKTLLAIAFIGAINWGILAVTNFQFELITGLLGDGLLVRWIFGIVGISGLWSGFLWFKLNKK